MKIAFSPAGGFMKLQRLGGCAAIAAACLGIAYLAFSIFVQKRVGDYTDLAKVMAAVSATPFDFYILNLLTIVVYTLFLIMFFALDERMQANAHHLTRFMVIAATTGSVMNIIEQLIYIKSTGIIVPTQDISAYRACIAVASGIGFMGLHAYGWACLLTGCAILKTRTFSRILGCLLLLAGILAVPAFMLPQFVLSLFGDIVHLLGLTSAVWIGIELLRQKQPKPAINAMTAAR